MLTYTRFLALAAFVPTIVVAQQAPTAAPATPALTPPLAAVRPHRFDEHGNVRIDQYYWLRDRDNPEVIKYLEDENAYTKAVMAHTQALQDRLFEELKGRVRQNDQSVPFRQGSYFYYTRLVEGKDYPIYARKRGSLTAPQEIPIDRNAMGLGKPFFQVMGWQISSGEDLLAFAVDTMGRRIASLRIKNLRTGEVFPEVMEHVTGNIAWAEDNRTLFYTRHDSVTLRWNRIYRHVVGTPAATDQLVYEEKDDTYDAFVFKTKSKAFVMIGSSQTLANEYRFVPAAHPDQPFQVLEPRRRGHEYDVDHLGDYFYIRTNDGAQNFRLMRTPVTKTARANWQEVIPNRADVFLQSLEVFKDYLVLSERRNGLTEIRVRPWNGSAEHNLDFGEPAYVAYVSTNAEMDTPVLRFGYQSLTTPTSTYDYDMGRRQKTLLKRDEILGGFDPANYITERLYTTACACPSRSCIARGSRAPRRCCSTGTDRTARAPIPPSRPTASRCSIAASSTRSRTFAADRRWAGRGTTTASCCTRRTRSPILLTSPTISSGAATRRPIASLPGARARGGYSWARSSTCGRSCSRA